MYTKVHACTNVKCFNKIKQVFFILNMREPSVNRKVLKALHLCDTIPVIPTICIRQLCHIQTASTAYFITCMYIHVQRGLIKVHAHTPRFFMNSKTLSPCPHLIQLKADVHKCVNNVFATSKNVLNSCYTSLGMSVLC